MIDVRHSTYEVRRRAVTAVQVDGMKVVDVAQAYQAHRASVYRWLARYKEMGKEKGLYRKSGSGRPRLFAELKSEKIFSIIIQAASEFGYETDFWTCGRIRDVIRKEFKVFLSKWTVWRRLREAKLTYQKPERRYFEASEEERKKWLRYEVPKIRRAVKKYRAILYFQDESNISLTALLGKTWAPRGKTPVQEVTGKRGGVSAMSAISGSGSLIFTLHEQRIASKEIIRFLGQMLKHHKRRHLVVVMDQAPPHRSKKTKVFIESQKRLHVFHLPKYSPDWNPDEQVWNHLKHQDMKGHQAKTKRELKTLARKKLTNLKKSRRKLRGIFFRCFVASLLH